MLTSAGNSFVTEYWDNASERAVQAAKTNKEITNKRFLLCFIFLSN